MNEWREISLSEQRMLCWREGKEEGILLWAIVSSKEQEEREMEEEEETERAPEYVWLKMQEVNDPMHSMSEIAELLHEQNVGSVERVVEEEGEGREGELEVWVVEEGWVESWEEKEEKESMSE